MADNTPTYRNLAINIHRETDKSKFEDGNLNLASLAGFFHETIAY